MILRSLSIRNWRSIAELELTGLSQEFVIIHGPNKAGKSSAIDALRGCLLDFEYDSRDRSIRGAIPRRTKFSPEVTVEFEAAGDTYELRKVFSQRTDGEAVLRRKSADTWSEIERGKEAGRKAKEILGVESSNEGLFKLLWLPQGTVGLPTKQSEISKPLVRQLENVMGSLVSSRHLDIMELLKEESSEYLTEKMSDRKNSPVTFLNKGLGDSSKRLAALEEEYAKIQVLQDDHDRLTSKIKTADADLKSAREGIKSLSARADKVSERRKSYKTVKERLEQSSQSVGDLNKRLTEHHTLTKEVEKLREQLRRGRANLANLEVILATHQDSLEKAALEGASIAKQRAKLEDPGLLIGYKSEIMQVVKVINRAEGSQRELTSIEQKIAGFNAPTKERLGQLRENHRKIEQLKANLKAGRLRVKATAVENLTLDVTLDDADSQLKRLESGASHEWKVRQKARIELPSLGRLEISRETEDLDLENTSREREQLAQDYAREIRRYGIEPSDPTALDLLAQQSLDHQDALRQRDNVTGQLAEVAPDGIASLKKQRQELKSSMEVVYGRRPDLRDWIADEGDLVKKQSEHSTESAKLQEAEADAKNDVDGCTRELEEARNARDEANLPCVEWQTALGIREENLERLGSEDAIREELTAAQTAMSDAQQSLKEAELTEDEQAVERRLTEERTAHEIRRDKLRALEDARKVVEGQLVATEGLHRDVTSAQAEVTEQAGKLRDARITAEAYRLLTKSLNDARAGQVQGATSPIASPVMKWCKQLGLTEYRDVEFSDSYMPEGLITEVGDVSVPLNVESHGTEEQLSILARLAIGGLLSNDEKQCTILDDPLTHSDDRKHSLMLEIIQDAARGSHQDQDQLQAGPLQVIIFTCHPDRFRNLADAQFIAFADAVRSHE